MNTMYAPTVSNPNVIKKPTYYCPRNYGKKMLMGNRRGETVLLSTRDQYAQLMRHPATVLVEQRQTDNYLFGSFKDVASGELRHSIVPIFSKNDLERDRFWEQRADLIMFLNTLGIQLSGGSIIKMAIESCIIVNGVSRGLSGYYDTLVDNAQNRFLETVGGYMGGEVYNPESNSLNSPNYSHVRLFSWIYYVESRVIATVAKDSGTVNVLEFGCSFGNSLFTKNYLLAGQGVNFYGADIKEDLLATARRYVCRNALTNFEFALVDVTKNNWPDRVMKMTSGKPIDVLVASHLLEHLPLDPINIISAWLDFAKKALIVSVPHTKEEANMSDHHHAFDVDGIRKLADKIESCPGVAEVLREELDAGIITVMKK